MSFLVNCTQIKMRNRLKEHASQSSRCWSLLGYQLKHCTPEEKSKWLVWVWGSIIRSGLWSLGTPTQVLPQSVTNGSEEFHRTSVFEELSRSWGLQVYHRVELGSRMNFVHLSSFFCYKKKDTFSNMCLYSYRGESTLTISLWESDKEKAETKQQQ